MKNECSVKIVKNDNIFSIRNFALLDNNNKAKIKNIIGSYQYNISEDSLIFHSGIDKEKLIEINRIICKKESNYKQYYNEVIDKNFVIEQCKKYADFLNKNKCGLIDILNDFECYNVAIDEINRAIIYLNNIDKNIQYFEKKVDFISSFLPLNQPFYSVVLFGIVPSFMAKEIFVKVPNILNQLYLKMKDYFKFSDFFPNMNIFIGDKQDFINQTKNDTDVVIFTGNPGNFENIKNSFKSNILFIFNGAGHNPFIITENADIEKAVESICRVCFYNQGQDCACPNSIMVHSSIYNSLKDMLFDRIKEVNKLVGDYRNKKNIIGKNNKEQYLIKIANTILKFNKYCIFGGEINFKEKIIRPIVFEMPLKDGCSFDEFYAPVIMLQKYENEKELEKYFFDKRYKENAMYVSIFGNTDFNKILLEKKLHTENNILRNSDLHIEEIGYKEYGGFGKYASCIYKNNILINGATLVPRDIYLHKIINN